MNEKIDLHNKLIPLFTFLNAGIPEKNLIQSYEATLQSGIKINFQLIAEAYLAFSCTLKLPSSYSKNFPLELLQANLNIDDHPQITIGVAVESSEIVIWSKQLLAHLHNDALISSFQKFSYYSDTINKWAGKESSRPGGSKSREDFTLRRIYSNHASKTPL